jgi:hypothetical protein
MDKMKDNDLVAIFWHPNIKPTIEEMWEEYLESQNSEWDDVVEGEEYVFYDGEDLLDIEYMGGQGDHFVLDIEGMDALAFTKEECRDLLKELDYFLHG